jgi:S-adenosylhomocysteine hydrolase
MMENEPPAHTRLRRPVQAAFARGHVERLRPRVQALAAELLAKEGASMGKAVHRLPPQVDQEIARLKLQSMGITIDDLTAEQVKYLASWDAGT